MMEVFTRMLRQMEGLVLLGVSRCMEWEVIECLLFFFFFLFLFFPEEISLITLQKGGTFLFHKMKKNDRGEKIMMKCLKVTSYDRTTILEELAAETN